MTLPLKTQLLVAKEIIERLINVADIAIGSEIYPEATRALIENKTLAIKKDAKIFFEEIEEITKNQ